MKRGLHVAGEGPARAVWDTPPHPLPLQWDGVGLGTDPPAAKRGPGLRWRVPICSGSVSSVCGVGLVISGGFTERPWIVDCGQSWGRGDGHQPCFCPPFPGGSHPRQGLPRVLQLLPQRQITKPYPGWELGGLHSGSQG